MFFRSLECEMFEERLFFELRIERSGRLTDTDTTALFEELTRLVAANATRSRR